jgi:hypothetical protein
MISQPARNFALYTLGAYGFSDHNERGIDNFVLRFAKFLHVSFQNTATALGGEPQQHSCFHCRRVIDDVRSSYFFGNLRGH